VKIPKWSNAIFAEKLCLVKTYKVFDFTILLMQLLFIDHQCAKIGVPQNVGGVSVSASNLLMVPSQENNASPLPSTLEEFQNHLTSLKNVDLSQPIFYINPEQTHVRFCMFNKPLILELEEKFLSKYAILGRFNIIVFVLDVEEEIGYKLVILC
jgi:hypothetical protein